MTWPHCSRWINLITQGWQQESEVCYCVKRHQGLFPFICLLSIWMRHDRQLEDQNYLPLKDASVNLTKQFLTRSWELFEAILWENSASNIVLICTSLIMSDDEHLFLCLLAIYMSSLEKCLGLSPIFWLDCLCFWASWTACIWEAVVYCRELRSVLCDDLQRWDGAVGWDRLKREGTYVYISVQSSSVQFSRSVVSDSFRPHESQHTRPPCPSPTPGVYSNTSP